MVGSSVWFWVCLFDVITQRVSSCLIFGFLWVREEWKTLNPREWEREYHPCVNLHREKWFLILLSSVRLRFASEKTSPHDVDFESSKSPVKSEIWNNPILHCAVLPTYKYCQIHVCDECTRSKATNGCHFCPFCDRTTKFVHRPYIYIYIHVKSPNTSQMQTFYNH